MLRDRIVQVTLILGGIFAGAHVFFQSSTIAQVTSYTLLAVGITVSAFYVPLCWDVLLARRGDRAAQLIAGITVSWLALTMASGWTILSYILGDASMLAHPVIVVYIFGYILGGVLHVTANQDESGRVSFATWAAIVTALVTGTTMGVLTVVLGLERGLAASVL